MAEKNGTFEFVVPGASLSEVEKICRQTDELVGYVKEMLGEAKVHCIPAGMGSEDFSEVMLAVPGSYLRVSLGSNDEGYTYGGHNPKVCFNEEGLPVGSAVYAYTAMSWLANHQ